MNDAPLSSPEAVARLLCGLGYAREEVEREVRKEFPDADATAVVDEALTSVSAEDAELDRLVKRDERAAVAAEHDTDKTMHNEGGR